MKSELKARKGISDSMIGILVTLALVIVIALLLGLATGAINSYMLTDGGDKIFESLPFRDFA